MPFFKRLRLLPLKKGQWPSPTVLFLLLAFTFANNLFALEEKASAQTREAVTSDSFDIKLANRIYVGPGRISVLMFPEPLLEAKIGAPDRLKVITSPTDPKELTLFWTAPGRYDTNLIVRTTKRTFVFDIFPSLGRHQDVVRIRGSYSSTSQSVSPGAAHGRTIHGGKIE